MIEVNGFKVIGVRELVIGKVVETTEDSKCRLVEYCINEYNTYINRTIAEFDIEPRESKEEELEVFRKTLGNYVRINDVYIEESVMKALLEKV